MSFSDRLNAIKRNFAQQITKQEHRINMLEPRLSVINSEYSKLSAKCKELLKNYRDLVDKNELISSQP